MSSQLTNMTVVNWLILKASPRSPRTRLSYHYHNDDDDDECTYSCIMRYRWFELS